MGDSLTDSRVGITPRPVHHQASAKAKVCPLFLCAASIGQSNSSWKIDAYTKNPATRLLPRNSPVCAERWIRVCAPSKDLPKFVPPATAGRIRPVSDKGQGTGSGGRTPKIAVESVIPGGEGGIRTPDTLASMPHFECGAFNHSATSPGPETGLKRP
jgi:hypothetical protein